MEESEVNYFFDTYAIIEILKQNENYGLYKGKDVTLTIFNLAELYYSSLNDYGEVKANIIYEEYKKTVVEVDDDTFKEAIRFRKEHKKKDLSYTDCIGYIYAKRNNLKFLTGDKEFENMDNVEFVKK